MRTLHLILTFVAAFPLHFAFLFLPEGASEIVKDGLPTLYNVYDTQNFTGEIANSTSYWTSSFITGFDNEQYVVISHTLTDLQTRSFTYRASSLSLGATKSYSSYVKHGNLSASQVTDFNITTNGYGFAALSGDKLSKIRTWSDYNDVTFDIIFEATSPVLFNGGAGQFNWVSAPANEWGMPACRTSGFLSVKGKQVEIDPNRSFTWYDRQWNYNRDMQQQNIGSGSAGAAAGNWTWFQVHLDHSPLKASMWAIDIQPNVRDRFATVRSEDGTQQFLPIKFLPDTSKTWVSNYTGIEYPLKWRVDLNDDDFLLFESVHEDQEMAGTPGKSALETAYEGFVTVSGRILSKKTSGFGIVEMVYT